MPNYKVFFCVYLFVLSSVASSDGFGDPQDFDSKTMGVALSQGLIAAESIDALSKAYYEFKSLDNRFPVEYYVASVKKEEGGSYSVIFIVPRTKTALGGGAITYEVSSDLSSVILVSYSK